MGCGPSTPEEEFIIKCFRSNMLKQLYETVVAEQNGIEYSSIAEESEGEFNFKLSCLGALVAANRPESAKFADLGSGDESVDICVNILMAINQLAHRRREDRPLVTLNRHYNHEERFRTLIELRGAFTCLIMINRGPLGINDSMHFFFQGTLFELMLFHPNRLNDDFRRAAVREKFFEQYLADKLIFPNDEIRNKFLASFTSQNTDLIDRDKIEIYGFTLLHGAILNRNLKLFKYFLDCGCIDVVATTSNGHTILETLVSSDIYPNLIERFSVLNREISAQDEIHFREEVFKELASSGRLADFRKLKDRQYFLLVRSLHGNLNSVSLAIDLILSGVCGDVWNDFADDAFLKLVGQAGKHFTSNLHRSQEELCKILQVALALPSCTAAVKNREVSPQVKQELSGLNQIIALLKANGIHV